MKLIGTILAGTTLAFAPAALAQTAPKASAQTTPQTAPAPATTPAPATLAAAPAQAQAPLVVSDTEVAQFATAALEINKIQADATIPAADKNVKMAAAASSAGIDPARFNAIGNAMRTDEELNKRIQEAAAKVTATTPAAETAPGGK